MLPVLCLGASVPRQKNRQVRCIPTFFSVQSYLLLYQFFVIRVLVGIRNNQISCMLSVLATDLVAVIDEDMRICSNIINQSDIHVTNDFYWKMVNASLTSWRKFIPKYRNMLHSNCWYVNFKQISPTMSKKLSSWYQLSHIEHLYSVEQASKIINAVLGNNQRASFIENSTWSSVANREFFCLPKVYLGGVPKCGTTTLYNLIVSHPNIEQPFEKEGQFWREFVLAPNQTYRDLEVLLYLYHFRSASKRIKSDYYQHQKFTIDASASTVFASAKKWVNVEKDMCMVPLILSQVLPDTKLIFILRNPTDRLWSDYWYFCSRNQWVDKSGRVAVPDSVLDKSSEIFHNLSISVMQEFLDCVRHGASEFECTVRAYSDAGEIHACQKVRLGISLYYFHVVKWLSVFKREQVMIVRMEDLVKDPYSVVSAVWRFMDLNPVSKNHFKTNVKSNVNAWIGSEKYKENFKMWTVTRNLLNAFFAPYNKRLAVLLNDDRYLWT